MKPKKTKPTKGAPKPCYGCKKETRGRLGLVPICRKCVRKAHGGGRGCGCAGCRVDPDAAVTS